MVVPSELCASPDSRHQHSLLTFKLCSTTIHLESVSQFHVTSCYGVLRGGCVRWIEGSMTINGSGEEAVFPAQPGVDDTTLPEIAATSGSLAVELHSPARVRKPQRKRRWLAPTIIILLLLVLVGAGGSAYFAYQQYPALNAAGLHFCNDLVGQKYSDAYGLLSRRLRQRFSEALFASMNQTLDATEGRTTLCGQAASNAFQLGVFPLSVSVATELTRATLGKRQGTVMLVYEGGRWVVDTISTSLLGINIDALLTAQTLCADLSIQAPSDVGVTQKYTDIWSLYQSSVQAQTAKADFLEVGRLHDAIDGKVETCAISAIGTGNTDAQTQVEFTTKRVNTFPTQGNATLRLEGGVWKFAAIDARIYGRDMAPALAATRWFAALTQGDCSAAYAGLSAQVQKRFSLATFTSRICLAPVDWSFYHLDPISYDQVSAFTYSANLIRDLPYDIAEQGGANFGAPTIPFYGYVTIIEDGGSWKVDSLTLL